jgi:pyrophosphate--fructose-6-phosphate 1-phosphotransferase
MTPRTVALLTAGGFAPCLSAAIGALVQRYERLAPDVRILAYRYGYQGLLTGDSVEIGPAVRRRAELLESYGGSPIGNSRVKLTNRDDLVRRGLVPAGADPLEVAAAQLTADGVQVLHTIGGDDTSTTAADLARHLSDTGHDLTVVGLPKTIDNDIVPVRQSLGAWTAADEGARFARNVVAEHNSGPRTLLVHEVMGRHCGWLTAATAAAHRRWLDEREWLPEIGLARAEWDVHAVYVPEMEIDLDREAERLRGTMDDLGTVTVFLSEGAGVESIVGQLEAEGSEVPRDAFGHVQLDKVNPGRWFADRFADRVGAQKVVVQKSGYFARSAPAGPRDLELIHSFADVAVAAALEGRPGLVGQDTERGDELRPIELDRIAGGKPFDPSVDWYRDLLADIGQPAPGQA